MKQRKHAEMMIQYAQNPHLVVEFFAKDGHWAPVETPCWDASTTYRLVNPKVVEIQKQINKVLFETDTALDFGKQAAEGAIQDLQERMDTIKGAYNESLDALVKASAEEIKRLEAKL